MNDEQIRAMAFDDIAATKRGMNPELLILGNPDYRARFLSPSMETREKKIRAKGIKSALKKAHQYAETLPPQFTAPHSSVEVDLIERGGNPLTEAEHRKMVREATHDKNVAKHYGNAGNRNMEHWYGGRYSRAMEIANNYSPRAGNPGGPAYFIIDPQSNKILAVVRGHPMKSYPKSVDVATAAAYKLKRPVVHVVHPYIPRGAVRGATVSPMFYSYGSNLVFPDGQMRQGNPSPFFDGMGFGAGAMIAERMLTKRGRNPKKSAGVPEWMLRDPNFKRELAVFRKRHGKDCPIEIFKVKVPPGFPKYMTAYGAAPAALYDAHKQSTKGKRIHHFGEGGRQKPWLVSAQSKGPKFLAFVGGDFKARPDWLYD